MMPEGDRLCHGDFHPFNVIWDGDTATVIDWIDATTGPPAADVARSYVLISEVSPVTARRYLERYAALTAIDPSDIYAWVPYVAAARLAEDTAIAEHLIELARLP